MEKSSPLSYSYSYYNYLVLELLSFEEVYVVCGFLYSFFCNCLSKFPIPIPLFKKKKSLILEGKDNFIVRVKYHPFSFTYDRI